ncbi:MAG: C-terminal binding protein [Dehalococcoidia bacterium]|nr:C-terminal binding protein [Dehalococcoidia bacterium]
MHKVIMTAFRYPGLPRDLEAYKKLGAEFTHTPCQSETEIITAVKDASAVITVMQPFTRNVLEQAKTLRLVSVIGIGYEGVDVDAATELGILVSNVPDYCQDEVSDHTITLILACSRKLIRVVDAVRAGHWDSLEKPKIRLGLMPPLPRLKEQTLGLVGFGRIARSVAPKAKAFGMRVIAHDPFVPQAVVQGLGVELVDIDKLLTEADFISLHAALTPQNYHLINKERLLKMKKNAYVINTARGGLIDEAALVEAIEKGVIAGAALDVTEPEPPKPDSPLFKTNKIILSAHTAQYSDEAINDLRRGVEENVFSVLRGEWPRGLVNPQAKEKYARRWGLVSGV